MVDKEFPFVGRIAGFSGAFRQIGANFGSVISSCCSKANNRDHVSGTTCDFPGLYLTVKSYDCKTIAQRVKMFGVSCIEYKYLSAA